MALFDGSLLERLFGKAEPGDEAEERLVAELTDMIVDTVEPKVRAHSRYRLKLHDCVVTTIAYLRKLGSTPLQPLLLTRANWNADPLLHAMFGRGEDIQDFLGRSRELRAFFDDPSHATCEDAYALLGMRMQERTVLGPAYEGGVLRQDVQQTTINFIGHRLVTPAATLQEARLEAGRRIINRLAQVTLGLILALDEKALGLERQKAYLGTRLRMLKLAEDGMQGIVEDPTTIAEQISEVEQQRNQAVRDFIETKSSVATLDSYLALIDDVFSHPERHVSLTRSELTVSRMSVKVDAKSEERHDTLTLAELRVGDKVNAVVAFVQCPRSELPPKGNLLAQAEKFL
jgi:hypothetical protein